MEIDGRILNKKIVLFGASGRAERFFRVLKKYERPFKVEHLCDNDTEKWGELFSDTGLSIESPDILLEIDSSEYLVIVSSSFAEEIICQIYEKRKDFEVYIDTVVERLLRREQMIKLKYKYEPADSSKMQRWIDQLLSTEAVYWDNVLAEVKARKDSRLFKREFQYRWYKAMDITKDSVIIDVGSGPLPKFGNMIQGEKLNYIPVDPLAVQYNRLLEKNEIVLPVTPNFALMECLTCFFPEASADYVIIHNAIDHSIDLIRCLLEALKVVKIGGSVLTRHAECEGSVERYWGLHKWDISSDEYGHLLIADEANHYMDITEMFQEFAEIELCREPFEDLRHTIYIVANIKKKKEIPEQFLRKYADSEFIGAFINNLFSKYIEVHS